MVSVYLDLAEDRAEREIPTTMADWCQILDDFLNVAKYPLLKDNGSISALEAKLKAEREYDIYRVKQDALYTSDFDKEIKSIANE